MNFSVSTPAAERVGKTLQRYLELNKRNAGELIKKKAGDVAIKLYQFCQEGAPTKAQIAQKVESLGWRVKRKARAWKKRRGEKTSKEALARMQAVQIARRASHIGYVASGWLPAVRALAGSGAARGKVLRTVKNPRGKVAISGMGGAFAVVEITNSTPGIVYVVDKTNAVNKALSAVADDLQIYIDRKTKEAWEQAKR